MYVQQTFSLRTCQKHTAAITSKSPSKLLFGTDMFPFDTRLSFTHTYKVLNVQKITFKFKSTFPVYGNFRLSQLTVAANFADKGIQQSHTTRKKWLSIYLWVFEWTRCLVKGNWNWKFAESK